MRYCATFLCLLIIIAPTIAHCAEQKTTLTPFPNDQNTWKIIRQNEILEQGSKLAEQGRYEEALDKYKAAMDPSFLNNEADKSYALVSIVKIYKYQGKLNEALETQEKYVLPINPKKEEFVETRLELLSLIKARAIKNTKPIYGYIDYLKTKDMNRGYPLDSHAATIIHLYDYLHDYDAGIAFVNEMVKYFINKGYLSSNSGKKTINEYTRVKHAWELDKQTGQHGHLQEVIKTSDIISW